MLSVSKMAGGGHAAYYLDLAREDYYLGGGEPLGKWHGPLAEHFGLGGNVQKEQLRSLLGGLDPATGNSLVQSQDWKDRSRTPGWDLTFSAPKSVSILWAASDPETRKAIQTAHDAAVKTALAFVQDNAAFSRTGKGGEQLQKCQLAFALFEHGTSRAQDPQLHTHCLVPNAGLCGDGKTRAVFSHAFFEHKMAAGAIYRSELAHQLTAALNLPLERDGQFFRAPIVPKDIEEHFSTRRTQIKEQLDRVGYSSAKAAEIATKETRPDKEHQPRHELFAAWKEAITELGLSSEKIQESLAAAPARTKDEQITAARVACHAAFERLEESTTVFSRRDFIRFAAEEAQAAGIPTSELLAQAQNMLENRTQFIELGQHKTSEPIFTTQQALRIESRIDQLAASSLENSSHALRDETVNFSIIQIERQLRAKHFDETITLSDEQRNAIRHITQNKGSIQCVQGYAGSGKTTLLQAARIAWEKDGYHVIGGALAARAAKELQNESGIKSHTLASLSMRIEVDTESTLPEKINHHTKEVGKEALRVAGFNPDAKHAGPESTLRERVNHHAKELAKEALRVAGFNPDAKRADPESTLREKLNHHAKELAKEALRVAGFNPDAKQADPESTLRERVNHHAKELGKEALRLAGLNPNAKAEETLKGHAAKLAQEAVAATGVTANPKTKTGSIKLTDKSIIVIDEAGMVGSKALAYILSQAHTAGAKVVLVGDTKQLQPIGQGSPFRQVQDKVGAAELTENRRQYELWEQEAINDVRHGNAADALAAYAFAERLHVLEDDDSSKLGLIEKWNTERTKDLSDTIILAATNKEAFELNQLAQKARHLAGELSAATSARFGEEQFFENDRVLFHKNDRALGISNGDRGNVTQAQFQNGKSTITVSVDGPHRSRLVTFSQDEYQDVTLGYACTTHKAQGATVERAFALFNPAMQDKHLSYVQLSRAREKTEVFVTKHAAGRDLCALTTSLEREKAQQLIREQLQQPVQHHKQQHEQDLGLSLEIRR